MRNIYGFLVLLLIPILLSGQKLTQTDTISTFPSYPEDQIPTIPTDIEADLDNSFPEPGAVLGNFIPRKWFNWKSDLYDKTGLKLGASYQMLYTSSSITGGTLSQAAPGQEPNNGLGGWVQFEAQWKLFNKDKAWEGSINFAIDGRHRLAGDVIPGELYFESGTQFAIDAMYLPWDPYFAILFYEQHFKNDKFWVRAGHIAPAAVLDFFRFKDARVSFTGPQLVFPLTSIPYAAPGLGMAFKWSIPNGKGLYLSGAFSDLNADPGEFNWTSLFDYGEVFAGVEIGKNWLRSKSDFDHLHLMLFYADERSSTPAPFVTESGWGFKVHGSKQWNDIVAFANYTYNTVQGGGFGIFTMSDHSANLGLVRLDPFKIKGEIGGALSMGNPMSEWVGKIESIFGPGSIRAEAQFNAEAYWRILLLKQLWVTPGIQLHLNPTYNPTQDTMWAPYIKARFFI